MHELIKYFIERYPVPSFIGYSVVVIGLILVLWHYARHTKIAQDISTIYSFFQEREIKLLDNKIDSKKYLNYEVKVFEYKRKILMYQKDLKTRETHLPTLIYLTGYENSKIAVSNYENSLKLLKFNDEENKFELKNKISEELSKNKERLGVIVFFVNGIAAYGIMMIPIVFYEDYINKNNVFPLVFFLFLIMIFQVYLGAKFLKYMSRFSNALNLLKMERVNIKYYENIEK
ncbi:hypothetical protein [Acinetobacter nosocomialis]|uniref:hypothetical protein n=1 Tax=Acinetobacter nosocomialis TaxID=106654 RepID=UPI000DE7532D|nr:hypothetical protein [Acinetobacter nosocomialis]RSN87037.1 hypothetical protein EA768_05895 [Acinetobacter nosocomialis]SSO19588.1 Uncharacterised protein [Acinetobacter nosocomialis]SSQ78675.1 Uncharacterised protein [Acinetobacter nosocomialis]